MINSRKRSRNVFEAACLKGISVLNDEPFYIRNKKLCFINDSLFIDNVDSGFKVDEKIKSIYLYGNYFYFNGIPVCKSYII